MILNVLLRIFRPDQRPFCWQRFLAVGKAHPSPWLRKPVRMVYFLFPTARLGFIQCLFRLFPCSLPKSVHPFFGYVHTLRGFGALIVLF